MIDWKKGLSSDQVKAAEHKGNHARLLAGPGTGKTKTITHRVLALVIEHDVDPSKILSLTFTRVASHQLRESLQKVLKPLNKKYPHVSTLHSFALRQLLKNTSRIDSLPQPLRIADDWEERQIIQEDLKNDLADYLITILPEIKNPIDKIKTLFEQLSADWETLKVDLDETQRICRDAKFLGAWRNHREIFGYTLRTELVYQLKKALNQYPDFQLESGFEYVLVDEFQDLNACDLAVIEELAKRGCELFVTGDDDQSIYGFRYADPTGIRNFPDKYKATELELEICYRCDKSILDIGEFVANLDYQRLPKKTRPKDESSLGSVHLQCYRNQYHEAKGIALRCKEILDKDSNTEILILIRSDYKGRISKPLIEALKKEGIPVSVQTEESPLESEYGRYILSILRLLVDFTDSLAWRTILQLQCSGIGHETQKVIRQIAKNEGKRYFDILMMIRDNPALLHKDKRNIISKKIKEIESILSQFKLSDKSIQEQIYNIITMLISDSSQQEYVKDYFQQIIIEIEFKSLAELLQAIGTSLGAKEQEFKKGVVNIMTMHRAKGLSADVVFVAGAEKQFIPGKNIGVKEDDERRLLYVSITRAKHELIITYCRQRIDQQRFTGSESGKINRDITPFLKDSPLKVENIQ